MVADPKFHIDVSRLRTLEDYLALPEHLRSEIVDGVLRPMVRPSKLHRRVQRRLASILEARMPPGVRVEEEEIVILQAQPPRSRIPDVVVFRAGADPAGRTNFTPVRDVLLAVEVVSEGTQTADRFEKPAEYARYGIPAFWRVELAPRIEVRTFQLFSGAYKQTGCYGRDTTVVDPTLPWVRVGVDDLVGDYTENL